MKLTILPDPPVTGYVKNIIEQVVFLTHHSVIRTYDFTVKRGKKSPDGYQKDVLIINGQFPGPLIEANW